MMRMMIMMMLHSGRAALQRWCDRCNMVCCACLQMGLRRSDRLNVEPESAMKGAGKPDSAPPPTVTVPDFLAFALQTSMGMTRTSVFHPTAQSLSARALLCVCASVRVRMHVCAAVSDGAGRFARSISSPIL
jgi:hypothetical protein